jgi:hypothetical protein
MEFLYEKELDGSAKPPFLLDDYEFNKVTYS